MTVQDPTFQGDQAQVNLAVQVAGIAAQVAAAMHSTDPDRRESLVKKLILARVRLAKTGAPPGLLPFIDVMCGLLRDEDVSALANELPGAYRAVYEQIVDETHTQASESEMTLRQVLDEVKHNVILVMTRGSYDQRQMMANTLLKMQSESSRRPDLGALITFLKAARALLNGEDPSPSVAQLKGPFLNKWREIVTAVEE
jgi:hypothetical protein